MDKSLLEELIESNRPFRMETAAGRVFDIPHRDFVAFSPRKTAVIVTYQEGERERFAIVPLLTITTGDAETVEAKETAA